MKIQRIALPITLALALAGCGSDGTDVAAEGTLPVPDASTTTVPGGPLGAGTGAIGTVEITVTHPDIEPIVYTVGCMGDTFPVTPAVDGVNGQQACDLLANEAVITRLVEGVPADQMCTEIYGGPDEAHIVGEADGVAIDATITRVNGCEIDAWESMLGLLPVAIGAT